MAGVLAVPLAAAAQQAGNMYRIGLFGASPPGSPGWRLWETFLQGLRDLGYTEGQNLILEGRYSEGREERLFELAGELVRRAELHRLRFHDLRHTYTSLLIAHGAHPKYIQAQLGHASIQTTLDRYGHLMPQLHQAEAQRLDQLVFPDQQTAPSACPLQAVGIGRPVRGSKMGAENTKGLAT